MHIYIPMKTYSYIYVLTGGSRKSEVGPPQLKVWPGKLKVECGSRQSCVGVVVVLEFGGCERGGGCQMGFSIQYTACSTHPIRAASCLALVKPLLSVGFRTGTWLSTKRTMSEHTHIYIYIYIYIEIYTYIRICIYQVSVLCGAAGHPSHPL
jgi:hypothetical protein